MLARDSLLTGTHLMLETLMSNWTSALSPFSRQGLPTLPLLLLLVYAVTSSLLGASIRHLENQSRDSVELTYAASTLGKDQASLMRDAQAMIGAPSQLRMQALLINLEEYEAALDAVRLRTDRDSALQAPLDELEAALPAIRSVMLQAARMDADRADAAIQAQVMELTRLDEAMQGQLAQLDTRLASTPGYAEPLANQLRRLSWIVHLLAILLVGGLIFGAIRSSRPQDLSARIAD